MSEKCQQCGDFYDEIYRIPDEIWAQICERAPNGLLCMQCVEKKTREIGVKLRWDGNLWWVDA